MGILINLLVHVQDLLVHICSYIAVRALDVGINNTRASPAYWDFSMVNLLSRLEFTV